MYMLLDEFDSVNFIKGDATYLITGGNGFIGSSIIFMLLELNRKVLTKAGRIILVVRN